MAKVLNISFILAFICVASLAITEGKRDIASDEHNLEDFSEGELYQVELLEKWWGKDKDKEKEFPWGKGKGKGLKWAKEKGKVFWDKVFRKHKFPKCDKEPGPEEGDKPNSEERGKSRPEEGDKSKPEEGEKSGPETKNANVYNARAFQKLS